MMKDDILLYYFLGEKLREEVFQFIEMVTSNWGFQPVNLQ